jgi:hypothetical protein
MSYPTDHPDGDLLSTIAMQLLGMTALISIIINQMAELDASELSGPELLQVHHDTRFAIREMLDELGARHPAAEIASASAIIDDVIEMIAESVFIEDARCLECESRRHPRRPNAKRH